MKTFLSVLVLAMAVTAHAEPFKGASPESFEHATKQMSALSKAMSDGAAILKGGDLTAVGAHSQYISSMVDSAKKQFGNTAFEPLGSCFVASNASRTWWSAQVAAAHHGGVEKKTGAIKGALDEFHEKRDDCLRSANPESSAKVNAGRDTDLKEKTGGDRECLTVFTVDPETKEVVEKPKPSHCMG
ncbi:hypothetical protein FBY10_101112 [Pseudomonas sp. SJZ103]|uniref:hypothetical protein n=1 Tax=unclassified Pseudomonas TaxID=196821 RepID=UPI0011AB1774|nr:MULTISPECIES: hypothetical protein [unclassified Pseudomonas]TWC74422.1 hypothetical protein FBY10_101112 [Pseudomonas sp. SJZ103]TWC93449.1 hypothetical protein FBY08_101946 [Pseudomonas sp. SJZ094]